MTGQDALPGMETVPLDEPPTYVFSGANIGGQMAFNCLVCGCIVQDEYMKIHTNWHLKNVLPVIK